MSSTNYFFHAIRYHESRLKPRNISQHLSTKYWTSNRTLHFSSFYFFRYLKFFSIQKFNRADQTLSNDFNVLQDRFDVNTKPVVFKLATIDM